MKERLVVIGNGMAPGRALERLLESAPDAYDITIFNAEPRVNYDRIMLSPVLAGDKTFDQIVIHGDSWYVKHGITLYKGVAVTKIDPRRKDRDLGNRRNSPLRQAHHRNRLAADHHPGSWRQSARRPDLSRLGRCRGDAACREVARQRRRDRRRPAWASKPPRASRSRAWTSRSCT